MLKLTDYTGKLNEHGEYLSVLGQLEKKCRYIEYVLVDEEDTRFTDKFEGLIISAEWKNKWWGTKTGGKNKVLRIKAAKEIFRYLRQLDTFCKYNMSDNGDTAEETDFGINDIAFFDDNELPLLFTTTHEGYVTIRNDLVK